MTEQVNNYNQIILDNYKKNYPNLSEFKYDFLTDSLVYQGNVVKLNGYGLSRIDPIFFNLNPFDIYLFFKDGLYLNINENEQMESLLNQLIITEDEIDFIKMYARKFHDKCDIYARNKDFFDSSIKNTSVKEFIGGLLKAKSIIDSTRTSRNEESASEILSSSIQEINQGSTQEKGMVLTRAKSGLGNYAPFNENEQYLKDLKQESKIGIAGFTSLIIIVASSLFFGIGIALLMLK